MDEIKGALNAVCPRLAEAAADLDSVCRSCSVGLSAESESELGLADGIESSESGWLAGYL